MGQQRWLTERFEDNRPRLRGVAYRMLGSLSEADDAVQEAGEAAHRVLAPRAKLSRVMMFTFANGVLRNRRTNLNLRAWLGLAVLALVMGLLLFGCAGTMRYWPAWIYLVLFFGMSAAMTLDLMRHDPALLERRIKGGPTAERRPVQRFIMFVASLGFAGLLAVPALDHRFGWSAVPVGAIAIGDLLFAIGFGFIARVYRENTYASATVEVAPGQRVITTGPYAVVRHPMYAGGVLYSIGTPLALGSYWGLLALAFMLPVLLWRLIDEERLLERDLPGYTDYQKQVRYRLVPRIW